MVMRVDFIFSRGGLLYEHANLLEKAHVSPLIIIIFYYPGTQFPGN